MNEVFWKLENRGSSFIMGEANGRGVPHLIVNRAQVTSGGCSACSKELGATRTGQRALAAAVGPENDTYIFCTECGDFIMGRVQADAVRAHYVWDWAIPLKGKLGVDTAS